MLPTTENSTISSNYFQKCFVSSVKFHLLVSHPTTWKIFNSKIECLFSRRESSLSLSATNGNGVGDFRDWKGNEATRRHVFVCFALYSSHIVSRSHSIHTTEAPIKLISLRLNMCSDTGHCEISGRDTCFARCICYGH